NLNVILLHIGTVRLCEGDQCVFPFFNNGVFYTDCVNVQNSSKPWCSTTDNYSRDGQRGDCLDYGTVTLSETTNKDQILLKSRISIYPGWCWSSVIKAHTDRVACTTVKHTVNGNSRGAQCVFPFFYYGTNYTACISFNESTPWSSTDHQYNNTYKRWCSTTDNYTRDGKWGECLNYDTVKGNSGGAQCVFPFVYNGTYYTDCIDFTEYNITYEQWCSTTEDYTRDEKWGECPDYGIIQILEIITLYITHKTDCIFFINKSLLLWFSDQIYDFIEIFPFYKL
uniref:Fibronectin type-II domain-containing protein n=1 Tax=Astyanax mexicanus TaxID=7994 RepID=A0A8B9JN12_ASTMX